MFGIDFLNGLLSIMTFRRKILGQIVKCKLSFNFVNCFDNSIKNQFKILFEMCLILNRSLFCLCCIIFEFFYH